FFVRSSAAIQDAAGAHDPARAALRYFWGPTVHGTPTSFFHDVDGAQEWLWPLHGARLPSGERVLFRLHLIAPPRRLGFAALGSDAVAIDDPRGDPDSWKPRVVLPLAEPAPADATRLLGSTLLTRGDYVYVYAAAANPKRHDVFLARYRLAALAGLS